MWGSNENRCDAKIKITKYETGATRACVTCTRCPGANLNALFNSASAENNLKSARMETSTTIAGKCEVFKKLKAAGKKINANNKFHRKLPRRLPWYN